MRELSNRERRIGFEILKLEANSVISVCVEKLVIVAISGIIFIGIESLLS